MKQIAQKGDLTISVSHYMQNVLYGKCNSVLPSQSPTAPLSGHGAGKPNDCVGLCAWALHLVGRWAAIFHLIEPRKQALIRKQLFMLPLKRVGEGRESENQGLFSAVDGQPLPSALAKWPPAGQ